MASPKKRRTLENLPTKDNELKLWKAYARKATIENRNAIVDHYYKQVMACASQYYKKRGKHPMFDYNEYISDVQLELIRAIDNYDYKRGIKFLTYFSRRLMGAYVDRARNNDMVTRTSRKMGNTTQVISIYATKVDKYGVERQYADDIESRPSVNLELFDHIVKPLGDRIALIFRKYYVEGYTYREIGKMMGFSESRCSQLMTQSLAFLRESLSA